MISQNHNFKNRNKTQYNQTYIFKNITIENTVWLGDRAITLRGSTIGEEQLYEQVVLFYQIPQNTLLLIDNLLKYFLKEILSIMRDLINIVKFTNANNRDRDLFIFFLLYHQ